MSSPDFTQSLSELKDAVVEHRRTATRGKRFSRKIVRSALDLAANEVSVEVIARETGIGASVIYAWIKRHGKRPSKGVVSVPKPRVIELSPSADQTPVIHRPATLTLQIAGFRLTIAADGTSL